MSTSQSNFSSLDLTGKVVLVTGASSGIGASTAILFAQRNALVILSARRKEHCQKIIEQIHILTNKDNVAHYMYCDFTKEDNVKELISNIVKQFGRIDYAFNNAGLWEGGQITHETDSEQFKKVLDLNVNGVFYCMKYELAQMVKQYEVDKKSQDNNKPNSENLRNSADYLSSHPYAIVNNSSCDGIKGAANSIAYSASKHAVVGLTRTSALEYAKRGVRINCVCPGWIHSEMTETTSIQMMTEQTPIGRVANAIEVAEPVVFLCSPAASFITGAAISVDGGYSV